jgi:hypothetical protein
MCSVLLPPGVYPIAVGKYININNINIQIYSITVHPRYIYSQCCFLKKKNKKERRVPEAMWSGMSQGQSILIKISTCLKILFCGEKNDI